MHRRQAAAMACKGVRVGVSTALLGAVTLAMVSGPPLILGSFD